MNAQDYKHNKRRRRENVDSLEPNIDTLPPKVDSLEATQAKPSISPPNKTSIPLPTN